MSGVPALDFTSSLYLGLRHPHRLLAPWEHLTLGKPAALAEPFMNIQAARALAALQGFEKCILAPSTLHIFWDLFGVLSQEPVAVYLDAGTYPIACWGVERATARGIPVRVFRHFDSSALRAQLQQDQQLGRRPIIVSDGFCPASGRAAPLRKYLACARSCGGLLVVDDTQSLGILGSEPGATAPYGNGGGGLARWCGASAPELMVVSSLAKGFGVPIAALSGSRSMLAGFEVGSETRTHCSPPSAATVSAALLALEENRCSGDERRNRLLGNVRHFRRILARGGCRTAGGDFPVQTLLTPPDCNSPDLHQRLNRAGLNTVLHRRSKQPFVSLILTASHRLQDIQVAAEAILRAVGRMGLRGDTSAPDSAGGTRYVPRHSRAALQEGRHP